MLSVPIASRTAQRVLISRSRHYVSSPLSDAMRRNAPLDIHPEVQDALAHNRPVVALETTIVTHGMPHPINLETAKSVESIVRETGAIPATIGLVGGRMKIGLDAHELEYLADVNSSSAVKVSRRDVGPAIAMKRDGGTTCSTTLIFAALAGIKVFATGGLGGVHRGGESSMDVSADLHELTRCPVGLVSAGVKSILDIGRTLEYLETLGVPVVSYAKTHDFPAFYSRRSGFQSQWRVEDPKTAAEILFTQWQLGMANGALFGVPIPEEFEGIGEKLQESVEQAVREADETGVSRRGKDVTPWLLKRVGQLTAGKSLASNVALIENTARVGGQIAVAYAQLKREHSCTIPQFDLSARNHEGITTIAPVPALASHQTNDAVHLPPAKLIVVGCAAVDITAQARASQRHPSIALHTTFPGTVSLSLGGVGRNVAEAAHRTLTSRSKDLASTTLLVAPVGNDAFGKLLTDETQSLGMRTDGLLEISSGRSAVCNMLLDPSGGLTGGVADMDILLSLNQEAMSQLIESHLPTLVVFDGNLSPDTLRCLVGYCGKNDICTFFEPTSVPKSTVILPAIAASLERQLSSRAPITVVTPNLLELAEIYREARTGTLELTAHNRWWSVIDNMALGSEFRVGLEQLSRRSACEVDATRGTLAFLVNDGIAQMAIHLLPFFQHIIIKCGDRGIITAFRVPGNRAEASLWAQEHTNVRARQVVGAGKPGSGITVLKHYPALTVQPEEIVNVTGAGDSLVGSMVATLLENPAAFESPSALDDLVAQAQQAAVHSLRSAHAVSPMLSTIHE